MSPTAPAAATPNPRGQLRARCLPDRHPGLPRHRSSHTYRRTNHDDPATILPHGAQQARFLVIATDGANWAAAESPTVTIAPMPPP